MNPALNGSSVQQRFERSNAIEIRNGIMFDFYPGLPHIIFALDTQVLIKISNVYINLKGHMKLDLCIGEALSYMHVTIETAFVGVAINYH